MEALKAIYSRKSVRRFSDREISNDVIHSLLKAGLSGPSCVNSRPMEFLVVDDKEMLNKMADANGRHAAPLKQAKLGILVCGNLDNTFKLAPDYWVVDCSAATQNILLAAHALGLGAVWLGTWPQMDRVQAQKELFDIPGNIVPLSLLAIGYPEEDEKFEERDLYQEEKVHFNKW